MLLQFSVENFKSFKERAVLSLVASSDKDFPENYISVGRKNCLKVISIFGANAAGKSNLLQAMTAAILTIRLSNNRQINDPLAFIVPFKFDEECGKKPTSFEFIFTADDGKRYTYGFSATYEKILEEYLYVYNSSKASTIFNRKSSNEYQFTSPALRKELTPLIARNTENKLFLATATLWNCQTTRAAYMWFASKINTYSSDFHELFPQTAFLFENDSDNSLKRFTTNLLHEADINIDDFQYESQDQDISPEQFLREVPTAPRNLLSTAPSVRKKKVHIDMVHTVENKQGKQAFNLPFSEESRGTQNIFMFSPILKKAFEIGETICIDEFDASIHPQLFTYLLKLFKNPSINKKNAQLIITTHALSLMADHILRRDQIYFVEKDRASGASELYSLDDFSPRKQENILKSYLLGRYGSIPDLPEEPELWE